MTYLYYNHHNQSLTVTHESDITAMKKTVWKQNWSLLAQCNSRRGPSQINNKLDFSIKILFSIITYQSSI